MNALGRAMFTRGLARAVVVVAVLLALSSSLASGDEITWRYSGAITGTSGSVPEIAALFPAGASASLVLTIDSSAPNEHWCGPPFCGPAAGYYAGNSMQATFAGLTWGADYTNVEVNSYAFDSMYLPGVVIYHAFSPGGPSSFPFDQVPAFHLWAEFANPNGPDSDLQPLVPPDPATARFFLSFMGGDRVDAELTSVAVVPEPTAILLLGTGCGLAAARLRRRHNKRG